MPRIVSAPATVASANEVNLTVVGSFANGFSFLYDQSRIISAKTASKLTINLQNNTSDRSTIYIQDFACTDVLALTTNEPTPFAPGTMSVTLELKLKRHELIDFAMFVLITDLNDPSRTQTLLCDPQVGNDPK